MSISSFKIRLKSLPIEYKDEHETFFATLDEELDQSPTLDKIWEKLMKYWSFLNYTLLENLINFLEYSDLEQEMDEFIQSLQDFQRNTRVCDFARHYNAIKKKEESCKQLVVHFQLNWKICTVDDVIILQNHILRKFHLPSFSVEIHKLASGSLKVAWLLPEEIAKHVNEQLKTASMMEFKIEHGISSITVEDCAFLLCSDPGG